MNKLLITLMTFIAIACSNMSAHAADFFGATVTNQEVPTRAWRAGVTGERPIVGHVPPNSPAAKYGLEQGQIILSINDKQVRNVNELRLFTTDTLSVFVLDGAEKKMVTIDRLAIEKEKEKAEAARIEAERKATPPPPANDEEPVDNSPPAVFDDNTLYIRENKPDPNTKALKDKNQQEEKKSDSKPDPNSDKP